MSASPLCERVSLGSRLLIALFAGALVVSLPTLPTAHAEGSFPPSGPPSGPVPELHPSCTVLEVSPPSIEYWVSYEGPVIAPGLPFTLENFLECPLGRKIVHPIWCVSVTVECPGGRSTERMCFHAGQGQGGRLQILPTDYRKKGAPGGTVATPNLPDSITPEQFKEFWEWYHTRRDEHFGGWGFCHAPSEDGLTHNCGSYFLLTLAKLLGITPDALRGLLPALGKCTHYSFELYPDSFFPGLEPLLLLAPPGGGIIPEIAEGLTCPAMAGVLAPEAIEVTAPTRESW